MKQPQRRKIIQISSYEDGIDVLCDDGSVWVMTNGGWNKLPDIPQDFGEPAPSLLLETADDN